MQKILYSKFYFIHINLEVESNQILNIEAILSKANAEND